MEKENKMGTAPITSLVWKMSLPAMLSMLVQALYNIIDSMFVAKISSEAFNAISIAFPLQMLMISLAVGTSVGINSLVSRKLGEGKKKEADSAAAHGLLLNIASWFFMALIGLFLTRSFFAMTTDNANVIEMGVIYVRIVTIFSFGVFIECSIEKTLQATGDMILPMCSQLLGCVVNIILDPILIFGIVGKPLGIAGAAIATVIGQIVAMIFCILVIYIKKHDVEISFRKFHFSWRVVSAIYQVGIPSIFMQAITSILVTFLNMILITFSEAAVNVFGVYFKIQSFVFMPVFGLTQGVMPVLGYNYGSRNKERLLQTFRVGAIGAVAIMFAGTLLFLCAPGFLLSLFSADAQTMALGIPALRIISLSFLPASMGILFSTLFQACGIGLKSLIISLVRQLVCILPLAYAFSKISVTAVWFSFPVAEIVALGIAIVFYLQLYNTNIKMLKPLRQSL